jgi:hypothetical protein
MKKDMSKPETIWPAISGKLAADGMTRHNYTRERAEAILSRTVAPVYCKRVLEMYETEIVADLPADKIPEQ